VSRQMQVDYTRASHLIFIVADMILQADMAAMAEAWYKNAGNDTNEKPHGPWGGIIEKAWSPDFVGVVKREEGLPVEIMIDAIDGRAPSLFG